MSCDETEALRRRIDVLQALKDRAEAARDDAMQRLAAVYEEGGPMRDSNTTTAKVFDWFRQERNRLRARFTAPIVCLCGSTRFYETFQEQNLRLTLEGKIVLSIGCAMKSDDERWPDPYEREAIKGRLDDLHKRKIDLCDSVLVVSVGGYFGCSTESEIRYAMSLGKPVLFLEPEAEERWNALA